MICRRLGGLCQSFGKSVIPVRSRWSFVSFFFFFLLVSSSPSPTLRGNFFLARRAASPPVRRPFALPGYQLCPRGPHVATMDPPVCVSHLHERGGPGARLVIPRRGRRNPCVRSLRSYKVQFKKILSSLVSTHPPSVLLHPPISFLPFIFSFYQ